MTPTGFEPVLPPWKGGVLTTWPWSLIFMTASRSMQYLKYYETPRAGLEPATARLTAVCSTNWAIEDHYKVYSYYIIYLQNNIQESFYISSTSPFTTGNIHFWWICRFRIASSTDIRLLYGVTKSWRNDWSIRTPITSSSTSWLY